MSKNNNMKSFLLILTLLSTILVKSQQFVIYNHTWYLQKLVNANGNESLTPNNAEVSSIVTTFGNAEMHTSVIDNFYGFKMGGNAATSTTLFYDEFNYPPITTNCQIPENCVFQNNFYFFLGAYGGYPMNYQISNEANYLKLTLTDTSGNKAIYFSQTLSVTEQNSNQFKIYPNPVKNLLNIQSQIKNLNIKILDSEGKIVLHKIKLKEKIDEIATIDLSNFTNGLYFLQIIDDKDSNNSKTFKIIKK